MLSEKEKKELVEKAVEIFGNAYAPYSGYSVGAAVLAESGKIYQGVNIENAAYPSSICAERSAIFNAVSHGERKLLGIAVVTCNAGSPCGACRQVMREFGGKDLPILIADDKGNLIEDTSLLALLPRSFGPEDLTA
ncbi:MAG: cytidine deaminase [Anaerolineaceae bacterium]|nr:cytidine deaminase [Anaerolineaceae bacterium]